MLAGAARVDITPETSVWMDGMIRAHKSAGIHDPLYAKALALCGTTPQRDGVLLVSVDTCVIATPDSLAARRLMADRTGIPPDRIILAATHNHSGPATVGIFNPREDAYVELLSRKLADAAAASVAALRPAAAGYAGGQEQTISHYRRALADDGHVVMNWEPWPADRIVRVLGESDPEVGVLKVVEAGEGGRLIAVLFNHAGHPNVLSGDNYLLSSDYPGHAERLVEQVLGGTALFFNAAQGSVDIDGLKDRDWEGRDRVGRALADAVIHLGLQIRPDPNARLASVSQHFTLPARQVTDAELAWAEKVLAQTGGSVQTAADGVGDDYKAALYKKLRARQAEPLELEQTAVRIGDSAWLSLPCELFTEIGQGIKRQSPLKPVWLLGLANGQIGYVPTREAIAQGGYESDTRQADDSAAERIVARSLELLSRLA